MKREELESRITEVKQEVKEHEGFVQVRKYKRAKKELKRLKKQLEELPKLKVGKWYKNDMVLYCVTKLSEDNEPFGYGFDVEGIWTDDSLNIDCEWVCNNVVPATSSEIQEALIKEMLSKYSKGDRCISTNGEEFTIAVDDWVKPQKDNWFEGVFYKGCFDSLLAMGKNESRGYHLFKDGKWAEIIEQPKVTINGDFTKQDLEKIIQTEFK